MAKPYMNMDDMIKDYDALFPSMSDQLKIIVAEIEEDTLVFSLSLFMQQESGKKVGIIHDLLVSRYGQGQVGDVAHVLNKMNVCLERIAKQNDCNEVRVSHFIADDLKPQDHNYEQVSGEEGAYWSKQIWTESMK